VSACARCGLARTGADLELCPRCLFSDDADEAPPPEAPPGIELGEEIGRGGMGRVFRARQTKLDRPVAVKYLPPELALDRGFQARFEREGRALARLSHPHVVGVHDFGTTASGESYLVMEYVPGGTLSDRIPLSEGEALVVLRELATALAYAHRLGVVHRDIKPDNVLFGANGEAKLADFGIARLSEGDGFDTVTEPFHVFGTPGYLPPEAQRGAAPHPSMDVFALGVLFVVMLTGKLPEPKLGGVPDALRPLLSRTIAVDPEQRPHDAAELLAALEPFTPPSQSPAMRAHGPVKAPGLPPDELSLLRAVALTFAGATALSLYAVLVSITPRTMARDEVMAFVVFGAEPLGDGRVLTRARFETAPTLTAAAGWVVAFVAYGLLRRHWRKNALEETAPERQLTETRAVLLMALVLNLMFGVRYLLELGGYQRVAVYLPVVGGVAELIMLYLVWSAVLEARRVSRPLTREPWLWAGLGLSVLPPVTSFVSMLANASR
jgi:hypothetical protein